ncbi:hypothetical protein LTR81_027945, partial [Elasticomyces elasticus]
KCETACLNFVAEPSIDLVAVFAVVFYAKFGIIQELAHGRVPGPEVYTLAPLHNKRLLRSQKSSSPHPIPMWNDVTAGYVRSNNSECPGSLEKRAGQVDSVVSLLSLVL